LLEFVEDITLIIAVCLIKWLTLPQPVNVEDSVEDSVVADVVAVEAVVVDAVVAVEERRATKNGCP